MDVLLHILRVDLDLKQLGLLILSSKKVDITIDLSRTIIESRTN